MLKCESCNKLNKDSCLIKCGHSFCYLCLNQLELKKCPNFNCRKPFNINELIKNTSLNDISTIIINKQIGDNKIINRKEPIYQEDLRKEVNEYSSLFVESLIPIIEKHNKFFNDLQEKYNDCIYNELESADNYADENIIIKQEELIRSKQKLFLLIII